MYGSTVNSNLYHYAGNNLVKYTAPDGNFTISIGWTSSTGAGTQGGGTKGIIIGVSQKYGLSFGKITALSMGSQLGWGANTGLKISFDKDAERVETGTSRSLDIGGSVAVPGTPVAAGGEISIDLDTGNLSISPSVTVGPGSAEVHTTFSITQTENTSDALAKSINDFNNQLEGMYLDYCYERYGLGD